jgi:hypothetical protein
MFVLDQSSTSPLVAFVVGSCRFSRNRSGDGWAGPGASVRFIFRSSTGFYMCMSKYRCLSFVLSGAGLRVWAGCSLLCVSIQLKRSSHSCVDAVLP